MKVGIVSFAHTHAASYAGILRDRAGVECVVTDPDHQSRPPGESGGRELAETIGVGYADTLEELQRSEPDAELFVILGDDAAAGFATWERYEEVAARATLVVVDRPGSPTPVDRRFDWVRVDIPELEISSTELRERVAAGRSIRFLTPSRVASAIADRGLYR